MIDNGRNDEKIVAIPFEDPTYNSYKDIDDLPCHIFDEMIHFFQVYKALENKETAVNEIEHVDRAVEVIQKALESYIINFCR